MPLRAGLTSTQMKLGWGYKRLEELKFELAKFRKDAYFVHTKDDHKQSRYRVYIEQKITPDSIGMLVAEFAYALRSSLDHLTWQLALLTTDSPHEWTCFPILGKKPTDAKHRYWTMTKDIRLEARSVIGEFQPYIRETAFKADPLWQLNRLCNIDKHQVVALGHIPFQIVVAPTVSGCWRRDSQHAVEISVPLAEKSKFHMDVEVPGVIFGDPIDRTDGASDFELTLDRLGEIYDFIRNSVVPGFEPFFAK